MPMNTTDWITIVVGGLQVITAIGVALWQVKRVSSAQSQGIDKNSTKSQAHQRSSRSRWNDWLYVLGVAIGVFGLVSLAIDEEPVTKSFVFLAAWNLTLIWFNIGTMLFFWFASSILGIVERVSDVQGKTIDLISDKASTSGSRRTRRKRRAAEPRR